MNLFYRLLIFVLIIFPKQSISQNYAKSNYYLIDSLNLKKLSTNERTLIDSCLVIFHNTRSDTSKLNSINVIVEESWDDNVWPKYNKWIYTKVKTLIKNKYNREITTHLKKTYSGSLNNLGYYYQRQGDNSKALEFYLKGIKIKKEIEDKHGLADTYNNLGALYNMQADIPNALLFYNKSLKLNEEIGNMRGVAYTYNNIGIIHKDQEDLATSLEYHLKSLAIKEEIGDKQGMAASYNNIGVIYKIESEDRKALNYYHKSLEIQIIIGDKNAIANTYNNIGFIHDNLGETSAALEYYENSLKISVENYDKQGMANTYNYIGSVYLNLGDTKKAETYGQLSFKLSKEIGYPIEIKAASKLLSETYKKQGKGMLALKMYETFILMKDSVDNKKNTKAAFRENMQYNYAKKAFADSVKIAETLKIKDTELRAKEAINKQQKQQQLYLFGIIFLMIILAGFTYNRFTVIKKQKHIITKQKQFVEIAHNEIRDSINYAERIQRSFLATKDLLNENLRDYFVFFRPKDVVSGDFYWASKLTNNTFAMVNADSTGHGIPGAIMSILNISSIEKAIAKGYTEPSEIFNDARKTIIKRLKNDGSTNGGKDGMDASIICFNFTSLKMTYCAAKNPIWVVREGKTIHIKPEKMPIGKHDKDHIPFIGSEMQLQKGDQVYTLTDGFQDQFGGPKNKKFMAKRLREFILNNSHLPLKKQHEKLVSEFNLWKENAEQVDDICVIGILV